MLLFVADTYQNKTSLLVQYILFLAKIQDKCNFPQFCSVNGVVIGVEPAVYGSTLLW